MRGLGILGALLLALTVLSGAAAQEAVRAFLPLVEVQNLGVSKLEVDAAGGIHIASESITSEGFYYFYCPPGCSDAGQMSEVYFSSSGVGPDVALSLDPQGRPHILVSAFDSIGYAWCGGDCRSGAGWNYGILYSFDVGSSNERAVTGDSLAVGPDGRSHFLMHEPMELFDQRHGTWYYTCAADCHLAGNWTGALIEEEQNFTHADLEVRPDGVLAAGVVAQMNPDLGMDSSLSAYMECAGDCSNGDNWTGVGLDNSYDDFWMGQYATMSMALTGSGAPRLAFLSFDDNDIEYLSYFYCDANCTDGNNWGVEYLSNSTEYDFDNGVHITLDAAGNPRIDYAMLGTILGATCAGNCTSGQGDWNLDVLESGSDIPADDIFLYSNCVVGAWFLKYPQSAYLPDGRLASIYTAEDYSYGYGGVNAEDPTRPACPIGVDMSLGRFSLR